MTYRRAAIPALIGGLILAALLWWAGASTQALHLPGTGGTLGDGTAAELERWLSPWAYDPPSGVRLGAETSGGTGDTATSDSDRYRALYETGLQIRFGALFVLFALGALLLVRRLPPVRGRTTAAFLAVWAWGAVAGALAVTVSTPWLIAAAGHGSYRFLPQLAGAASSGRQIVLITSLVAAAATVFTARIAVKDTEPPARAAVPARAARLAATAGTALIALSLVVLSYDRVAVLLQTGFTGSGLLAEPGDLLRQWLLLGGWTGPAGTPAGEWLLYRAPDALVLVVVWCALRWLPGLLTRATVPATAVVTVCATVLGLLLSQAARIALSPESPYGGFAYRIAGLGHGIPAALTWGLLAGTTAAVVLRVTARGGERAPARRRRAGAPT
ncbi:hypothetical protein ACFYNX_27865 [Streptomyces sp. NPDC007872]|uniref:hypothetical protein n=1 Tax=Streptomyces sp. NPDC007872 TaxID=3364782 RepID=UPI0036976571